MVWHDSQHRGSQIHDSEVIIFPYREKEQEKWFWGSHNPGEPELSKEPTQICYHSPGVYFEPSFPPLWSKGQLISSQQAPRNWLNGNTGAEESTCYSCFTKRFLAVTYMRILITHKCSPYYKLLSLFSVFTPESAKTPQRQMAPHDWYSAGSCLPMYHIKHSLASTQSGSSWRAGGGCEFTHQRKAQSYLCNNLENLVIILEPR